MASFYLSQLTNHGPLHQTYYRRPADPSPEMVLLSFIALSILTIDVIYIAVTNFLQKREREKFEKEESAADEKKEKGGKKNNVRARAGPRGFGQKGEEDED